MGQRARGSCATERELTMRTNVKNPTLTSNSATLGWGTLKIPARIGEFVHPTRSGGPPAPRLGRLVAVALS
jgi:hypothetical protein